MDYCIEETIDFYINQQTVAVQGEFIDYEEDEK